MSKDIFTKGSFFKLKNSCFVQITEYNEAMPYPVAAVVVNVTIGNPRLGIAVGSAMTFASDGRHTLSDADCSGNYDIDVNTKCERMPRSVTLSDLSFFPVDSLFTLNDGCVVRVTGHRTPGRYPVLAEVISAPEGAFGLIKNRYSFALDGEAYSPNAIAKAGVIDMRLSTRQLPTEHAGLYLSMESESFDEKPNEPVGMKAPHLFPNVATVTFNMPMDVPGYESLSRVLHSAYNQSARGKGKERHANDLPFELQPLCSIVNMPNIGAGGSAYQIIKKTHEACGMASRGDLEHAIHESYGVIVYAASMILHFEKLLAAKQGEQS